MNPQLVESIMDRIESLSRMAAAFHRDANDLRTELKTHLYHLTSTDPDSVAFVAGVDAALDKYIDPALIAFGEGNDSLVAETKANLRQMLLDNYQLDKTNAAMNLGEQVKSAEELVSASPVPVAAVLPNPAISADSVNVAVQVKEELIEKLLVLYVQDNAALLANISEPALAEKVEMDLRVSRREALESLSPENFEAEVSQKLGLFGLENKMALLRDVANMISEIKKNDDRREVPIIELLRKHLSPELVKGGKGLISLSRSDLPKYTTGVHQGNPASLGWATGWYGVTSSPKGCQLLVSMSDTRSILLDGLGANDTPLGEATVFSVVDKKTAIEYRDLNIEERMELTVALDMFFSNQPIRLGQ